MVIIAPMQAAKKDKKRKATAKTLSSSGHGVMVADGGFHQLGFVAGMPAIVEQGHPNHPHPQSFHHAPPPLQPPPLMVHGGQLQGTCDKCSRMLELETEYLALRRKLGLLEKNYVRLFRQSLQQDKDRFKSASQAKQQTTEEAKEQQHKTTAGNGSISAGPDRALQIITEFGHSVALLPSGEVAPEDLIKKKAIRYERLLKPIDGLLTREEEIIKANLVRHDLDRLGYVEWHEGERGPRKRALPLSRPRVPATELSKKNLLRKAAEIEKMIESQAAPPDTDRVTMRKCVGVIMSLLIDRQKESDPISQPANLAPAVAVAAAAVAAMGAAGGVTSAGGQQTVNAQVGAGGTLQHPGTQGVGMGDPTGLTVNPFTMGGMSMAMAGMAANSAAAAAAAMATAANPAPSRTSGKGGRGRKEVASTVSHEEEDGQGGGGKRQKTGEEIPMLDPTGRQQQMLQQQQQLLAQQHAAIQQHWQQQQQRRAEEGGSETMDPRLMQQRLSVAAGAAAAFNPLGAAQSLPQLPSAGAQGQNATTTESGKKGDGGQQRPTLQQTYIPGGPYMLPGLNTQQTTDQSSASNAQTQYFGAGQPFAGQNSVFGSQQAFNATQLGQTGQTYGGQGGMPQSLPMLGPYAMQLVRPLVPQRQDSATTQPNYMPVAAQQPSAYTSKQQNQQQ